jgi:hypothetical protein
LDLQSRGYGGRHRVAVLSGVSSGCGSEHVAWNWDCQEDCPVHVPEWVGMAVLSRGSGVFRELSELGQCDYNMQLCEYSCICCCMLPGAHSYQ